MFYLHVYAPRAYPWRLEEGVRLEWRVAVSCLVSTGFQTWVPQKSNKCSKPRSHLSLQPLPLLTDQVLFCHRASSCMNGTSVVSYCAGWSWDHPDWIERYLRNLKSSPLDMSVSAFPEGLRGKSILNMVDTIGWGPHELKVKRYAPRSRHGFYLLSSYSRKYLLPSWSLV